MHFSITELTSTEEPRFVRKVRVVKTIRGQSNRNKRFFAVLLTMEQQEIKIIVN